MARSPAPTQSPPPARYPPRDADGRIPTLPDMLGGVVFSIVIGTVLLVAIDGIITLLGPGTFGAVSGWLGGILAVWLFVEEFRAWKGVPIRWGAALVATAVAVGVGAALGAQIPLNAVFAGAISVTVAAFLYAVIWFFGIRYLADRLGEGTRS